MTREEVAALIDDAQRLRLAPDLHGLDLHGLDLRGLHLYRADLRRANLQDANLRGSNLQDADLRGSNLRGSNLQDADLRRAELQDADLRWATLEGVNWCSARLISVNWRGAVGVYVAGPGGSHGDMLIANARDGVLWFYTDHGDFAGDKAAFCDAIAETCGDNRYARYYLAQIEAARIALLEEK